MYVNECFVKTTTSQPTQWCTRLVAMNGIFHVVFLAVQLPLAKPSHSQFVPTNTRKDREKKEEEEGSSRKRVINLFQSVTRFHTTSNFFFLTLSGLLALRAVIGLLRHFTNKQDVHTYNTHTYIYQNNCYYARCMALLRA